MSARLVEPGEHAAVYAALARAFADDPVTCFIFPDDASRERRLRGFYRATTPLMVAHGAFYSDDQQRGGAIWQAPDPPRPPILALASMVVQSAVVLRSRVVAGIRVAEALEQHRLKEPHWYLAILGTDPRHQGKGVGSELMRPILERCDAENTTAYLESSKRENIPFYERHGFEVSDEVQVPGGPLIWPMVRRRSGAPA